MVLSNFKNFFKNILYSLINFAMIIAGIGIAGAFFLFISAHILKLQNSEFLQVMKNYLETTLENASFIDIFDLNILKQVFMDMIHIGNKYDVNLDLYFFLIGSVSIAIVFFTYKGSVALVDHLHKIKFNNKYTKHGLLSHIVKIGIGIITSVIIALILYLTGGNAIITICVYFVLDSIELLFITYYVYFTGIKFNKFITSKNTLRILGLFAFSQSFFILLALIIWRHTPFMSILIVLPLLAYSTTNVRFTVTEYFKKNIKRNRWNARNKKTV